MCGRYIIFTSEEYREMKAILKEISKHYKVGTGTLTPGEIFPSFEVPAILSSASGPDYSMLKWGFEMYGTKRTLINARSETLEEKKMFKFLLESKRCLLPANGFFEWNEKQKYFIKPADLQTFYMAGLYNSEGKTVIVTTNASSDMIHIHDRMPVIFNKETGRHWLEKYDSGLLVPYGNPLDIKKTG